MKEKNKYITVSGSNVKVLVPDAYETLEDISILKNFLSPEEKVACAYISETKNSFNALWAIEIDPKKPHILDNKEKTIALMREKLKDNQGVIEVKEGISASGQKYVYSVIKMVMDGSKGSPRVNYAVFLNIDDGNSIVEIFGFFEEIGMTGTRESLALTLAERAKLCYFGPKGIEGWSEDPYDPSYTKGIVKNLAEKEGLDILFPEHPLSQARKFLLAAIDNRFIAEKKECPDNNEESKSEEISEEEILRLLFVDECRRDTYLIEE